MSSAASHRLVACEPRPLHAVREPPEVGEGEANVISVDIRFAHVVSERGGGEGGTKRVGVGGWEVRVGSGGVREMAAWRGRAAYIRLMMAASPMSTVRMRRISSISALLSFETLSKASAPLRVKSTEARWGGES